MKNINYILTFVGWIGFTITLLLIILTNKCSKNNAPNIINVKTEIHKYYDTTSRQAPLRYTVPGEPIFIPVPANVDTAFILANYFAKFPYARIFQDSNLIVTLKDTLSQNKFYSPGKFTYKWLAPIKTIESTTLTVEAPKKIHVLVGGHLNFNTHFFKDYGPDIYIKTKREQLIGLGYNINTSQYSVKMAISLNQLLKKK